MIISEWVRQVQERERPFCVRRARVSPNGRIRNVTIAEVYRARTFEEAVEAAFHLAALSPHKGFKFLVRRRDRGPYHPRYTREQGAPE